MLPGSDGYNINGPSLVRVPDWLPDPLGRYYLYFAHHRGSYIRLAHADTIDGPWTVYRPGTLRLDQAPMARDHIASPDMHVDHDRREIRMYFHGPLVGGGGQKSFIARSHNGIDFTASPEPIGNFYLRMVPWQGQWIGLAMDASFYRSPDGLSDFTHNPICAIDTSHGGSAARLRHVALRLAGSTLDVCYTMRGTMPESIWRCRVALGEDWNDWRGRDHELVLAPERPWEGADEPLRRSQLGPARGRENALRDPAIFAEDGKIYLLYAVAGESGIAIARLKP